VPDEVAWLRLAAGAGPDPRSAKRRGKRRLKRALRRVIASLRP
jgi:hypothetical protein